MEPPKHFLALTFKEAFNEGFNSAKNNALFNSCFLDEPEKPVIPKYVADFISSEQRSFSTLSEVIDNMDDEGQILNWFYINSETFAKAWIYGYKVEKEKLYTVELPSSNKHGRLVLVKDDDGDIVYDCYFSDRWKEREYTKLTESEIKKRPRMGVAVCERGG